MKEFRLDSPGRNAADGTAGSPEAAEDLRALKQVTARDVPSEKRAPQ